MIPELTFSGAVWFVGSSWLVTGVFAGGIKLYKKSQIRLSEDTEWMNLNHIRKMQNAYYGPPTMANEAEAVNPTQVIPGEVVDLSESRIPEKPSWMK